MPLSFTIVEPANITDPDGALVANPGGESNNGAAGVGDTITFDSFGDVLATIDEDVLTDDPANTLSEEITVNGITFPAGARVETDYSFVAVDDSVDPPIYFRISHLTINNQFVGAVVSRGFDPAADDFAGKYTPGAVLTIVNPDPVSDQPGWEAFVVENNYNLGPGQAYDNDVDLVRNNGVVICFGAGAAIRLADGGERLVERMRVGDVVATESGGARTVRWVGRRRLSAAELAETPSLRPIRIAKDALGEGAPSRDLLVSPQHRMLVRSPIVRRMFGVDSCLTAAKHLLGAPGVETVSDDEPVVYFHILLDSHDVLFANDAPSESLLLGAEALLALSPEARAEVAALFPEALDPAWSPIAARDMTSGGRAARLVMRSLKNGKPLLTIRDAA